MPDLDLLLDADPMSVAPARAEFRRFAGPWVSADDVDEAAVIISELVTNAQQVCPDDRVLLHVGLVDGVLRIEVVDGNSAHPSLPDAAGSDDESGRGLHLVAALAQRWGTSAHRLGKCVWAELPVRPAPGQPPR